MSDLASYLFERFPPGATWAFVGAGGKTTAIRALAAMAAARGMRARITTTTRIGSDELTDFPLSVVTDADGFSAAMDTADPVRVVVGGIDDAAQKLLGVAPALIDALDARTGLLLLVEADGSRRRPLKVPTSRDPVIPRTTSLVVGLMGASGFGETIAEESCYNHEGALDLLGCAGGDFDARSLTVLALHERGLRKGVLPGMAFCVVVNQADIPEKRAIARETIGAIAAAGVEAVLVSLREGRMYETT